MKIKKTWLFLFVGLVLLWSCPSDNSDTPDDPSDPGKTEPPIIERRDTTKLNTKRQRVVHTMWGEPEEDPRTVIGYQLDDGTPYFDHYVMLYGFRLRYRDCTQYPDLCNKTGLHLHFGDNVQKYYVDQYDKYLKPVRDRGIRLVFSIVPNDDGVCVGSLYRWGFPGSSSWESVYGEPYPFHEQAVAELIRQIKEFYDVCPFDGIAYDEEYGNQKDGPIPGRGNVYGAGLGQNLLRFAYELEKAIGLPNPGDFTQEIYEIRYNLPASYTFIPTGEIQEITVNRNDIIDYSYSSTYGGWSASSGNGLPKERFGPASIAIGDITGGPRPPVGRSGPGVIQRMEDHLKNNFGVVMYYCLRSRDEMTSRFPNHYGADNPPVDVYFSQISGILHGKRTEYIGPDYPRVWWW